MYKENDDYSISSGKLKEIFSGMLSRGCTSIVFNGELTPTQVTIVQYISRVHVSDTYCYCIYPAAKEY